MRLTVPRVDTNIRLQAVAAASSHCHPRMGIANSRRWSRRMSRRRKRSKKKGSKRETDTLTGPLCLTCAARNRSRCPGYIRRSNDYYAKRVSGRAGERPLFINYRISTGRSRHWPNTLEITAHYRNRPGRSIGARL